MKVIGKDDVIDVSFKAILTNCDKMMDDALYAARFFTFATDGTVIETISNTENGEPYIIICAYINGKEIHRKLIQPREVIPNRLHFINDLSDFGVNVDIRRVINDYVYYNRL
jgi:hypothetical protein